MNLKQLFEDDNAVSPVIGVILMVAITVILAAVIASFVLGLGDSAGEAAPQFTISCNTEDGTITHNGGDDVDGSQLDLIDGGSASITSTTLAAGDGMLSGASPSDIDGDEQIRWNNPDGSGSNIVAEC